MSKDQNTSEDPKRNQSKTLSNSIISNPIFLAQKIFIEEDRKVGGVNPKIYHKIIHGSFGYILAIISVIVNFYISSAGVKASKFNIDWGQTFFDPKANKQTLGYLTTQYYLYIALQIVLGVLMRMPILWSISWFGRKVHSRMFFNLIHSSPTKFLQRTPNGVIVNRFSKDINTLDQKIVWQFSELINKLINFLVLGWTITKGVSSWAAFAIFVIFTIVSLRTRNRYMQASREVTRLTLISQSPIIGTSIGSIMGGSVILATNSQGYLRKKMNWLINENTKNQITGWALHYWFDVQLEILQELIVTIPLYAMMIWAHYSIEKADKSTVAFIKFIQKFTSNYYSLILKTCSAELNSVSVERLDRYEKIDPEVGYLNLKSEGDLFKEIDRTKLKKARLFLSQNLKLEEKKKNLFSEGRLRFCNVSARYPTSKNNVLSGLDLEISAGQTIGIVGRTGAGKSSFTKLIWRALDPLTGSIEIDGTDISTIDLKELRTGVNVILQNPTVFGGTLLSNLSNNQRMSKSEILEISDELVSLGFPKVNLRRFQILDIWSKREGLIYRSLKGNSSAW